MEQLTQTKIRYQVKKASIILPILAFVLFIANYHICDFFYPTNSEEDIKGFWHTKNDIYSLIISILFIYTSFGKIGKTRFIFDIFVGLTAANVVDRFFYDTREWRENDIIMIALTLVFAVYNYKKYARANK